MASNQLLRVQRRLEIMEDWKTDHEAAMKCFDLEDWLDEVTSILDGIEKCRKRFCKFVFHANYPIELVESTHGMILLSYKDWLVKVRRSQKEIAKFAKEYSVEGLDEFYSKINQAEVTVETWKAPRPSILPASRIQKVTDTEAEELQTYVRDSQGGMKLMPVGVPVIG